MPRPGRPATVVVSLLVLAACGSPPGSGAPATGSAAPLTTPAPSATEAPAGGTGPGASTPGIAADPPPLTVEQVAEGLVNPIGVTDAPGGWLLINEQPGRVVALQPDNGERSTVVDLGDRIRAGGEQGLLGLVLHPDWPEEARAFVHYTDANGNAVLSELTGSQDGDAAPVLDAESEQILLGIEDPYPNHNGGQLAFGPDGHLWVGLGDGGSGGDPLGHGQNATTLLGAILRLDISIPGAYAIPSDNPYADGSGAPENYLTGLRNPWRFSFDPETDALWVADVGQNAFEEVNRLDPVADAGANLGWNVMEATHCFAEAGCSADGLVLPLAEYGRDLGYSVTGGYVYRGTAMPDLVGWYVFADYDGTIFGVPSDAVAPANGTALAPHIILEAGMAISAFGVDADGELYVTDYIAGDLYRIVAGG